MRRLMKRRAGQLTRFRQGAAAALQLGPARVSVALVVGVTLVATASGAAQAGPAGRADMRLSRTASHQYQSTRQIAKGLTQRKSATMSSGYVPRDGDARLRRPSLKLSSSPLAVKRGGKTRLTWRSTDAASCSATGAWNGRRSLHGEFLTARLRATSTYVLTCTGRDGAAAATVRAAVKVLVAGPPPTTPSTPRVPSGSGGETSPPGTEPSSSAASGVSGTARPTPAQSGTTPAPSPAPPPPSPAPSPAPSPTPSPTPTPSPSPPETTVTLSADTPLVPVGGTATVTWASTNAGSCSAAGDWSGARGTQGSFVTPPLATTSTYSLTCAGAPGTASKSVTVAVDSITITKVDNVAGATAQMATFGSWDQHVVSNSGGIFIAYLYSANHHDPDYWRLARSTDRGKSFRVIYDGAQDGPLTTAPAVETDEAGNIYVIAPTFQTSDWLTGPTLFYRFSASASYAQPLVARLKIGSSSKFSTVFDPTRNLVDILFRAFGAQQQPTFFSITTSGVVSKEVKLFAPAGLDPNAVPEYPVLTIAPDGTLFAGWSTLDTSLWKNGAGTQNYYDAHFVASPNGGSTWIGKTGNLSLPIIGDDTGPAFTIDDESNPDEFAPWGSSTYHGNWNLLQGLVYNSGNLDFYYGGPLPSYHDAYARMNWQTRAIDERMSPYFSADGIKIDNAGGAFAQSATAQGRLYFVGGYYARGVQRLAVLYSDTAGRTWHQGARSDDWSGCPVYVNTSRDLVSDGSVIGSFTATSGGQTGVYFFRSAAV